MTRWIEPPLEPPDDYYDDHQDIDFSCDEEEKAYLEGWWKKKIGVMKMTINETSSLFIS